MSDFIREVEEEYRRERIVRFLSRFQIPIALAVIAILVGAGWWRVSFDNRIAAAQKADAEYQAAETLAKAGDDKAAKAAYETLVTKGPPGYAVLASMRVAEIVAKTDPEAAAKRFDTIADSAIHDPALADTARFRAALLRVDTMGTADFARKYDTFTGSNFAYAASMRELLALSALKGKDDARAGKLFDDLLVDPKTPPAMRERARVFLDLVTGGPATPTDQPAGPATVTPVSQPAPASPVAPAAAATKTPAAGGTSSAAAPTPAPQQHTESQAAPPSILAPATPPLSIAPGSATAPAPSKTAPAASPTTGTSAAPAH